MTTEALTPEKMDELERLLEAAWTRRWDQDLGTGRLRHPAVVFNREEDASLAVAAVNALPALLAIARREERLRLALKGLLAEVEWWEDSDTPYLIYAQMNVEAWREARAALTPEEGPLPSSEWEPDDELAGLPLTPEEGQAPE